MKPTLEQIEAGAKAMWNLHTQGRSYDELTKVEQDQVRSEIEFILGEIPG